MATSLRYPMGHTFLDNSGNPLASGTVQYYEAGTTTAEPIYSDAAGATALPNPITLNSAGRAVDGSNNLVAIYLSDAGNTDYKEVVKNSGGTTIWTDDNIPEPVDPTASLTDTAKPRIQWSTDTDAAVSLTAGNLGGGRLASSGSNNITYSPISASTAGNGNGYLIKKTSASNTVTFNPDGSETVDGHSSFAWHGESVAYWFISDGANWRVALDSGSVFPQPQGYLTLVSNTPVITSDQAAATTVYYTPDKGNLIPLIDGVRSFSELSLSLASQHVANAIYDIFAFMDDGTLRIGTGPAWSTATAGSGARGTGAATTELSRVNGLFVNTVSMTARNGASTYTVAANRGTYVGSIFMDGTNGQVTCHRSYGQGRKWGLWNAYNQRDIILQAGDATASWTYNTSTIRASNGDSSNVATVFQGIRDGFAEATFAQRIDLNNVSTTARIGIGVNSTTAFSGYEGFVYNSNDTDLELTTTARHTLIPALGINNIQMLETVDVTGTPTFQGGNDEMLLTVKWRG